MHTYLDTQCVSPHKSPPGCKQGDTETAGTRLDHMRSISTGLTLLKVVLVVVAVREVEVAQVSNTLTAVNMEPLEEYHSPFDFEQGVNTSYLYLSPAYSDTPPSSPAVKTRGSQLLSDSAPEVGEDAVTIVTPSTPSAPAMTEEERLDLQQELAKVEDEIQTLTQVLSAKEKQVVDIKRKLGITPLNELKQNISKTWQGVTTSNAYKRTSETISQASLKATAALSTVGSAIGRKLEDVSMRSLQHSTSMPVIRNAPTFKSFEEKVETLKTKMTPSTSTGNLGSEDGSGGAPADESLPNQQEDSTTDETPMH